MTKQNAINNRLATPQWMTMSLQNGWLNYGTGFADASYSINNQQVQLRGVIKGGTSGIIFVFPPNATPNSYKGFRAFSPDVNAYCLITPAGEVNINTANNAYVYLDNILFPLY